MSKKTGLAQDGYQPVDRGYQPKDNGVKLGHQSPKQSQQPSPPPKKP